MGGASQELEYDARGRITGIVDGNGSETKYLLDEWGRITGVVKADGSTERYAYNFAGAMVSSTDGEGHTTGKKEDEGERVCGEIMGWLLSMFWCLVFRFLQRGTLLLASAIVEL